MEIIYKNKLKKHIIIKLRIKTLNDIKSYDIPDSRERN